ncbi:MAG TPA: GYF domain-containing protein, partial [Minicystis sp.]|nr:GYF domain-containing protein [Minicystis sp.]
MSDWYLKDPSGASSGPFATMDIVQWITAGRVGAQHAVCGVGSTRWVAISEVPMFGGALASRGAAPQAPQPQPGGRVSVPNADVARFAP